MCNTAEWIITTAIWPWHPYCAIKEVAQAAGVEEFFFRIGTDGKIKFGEFGEPKPPGTLPEQEFGSIGFALEGFSISSGIPENEVVISSGPGPDTMFATFGLDVFVVTPESTGNVFTNDADLITNFEPTVDVIHLPAGLTYGGATQAPEPGQYSVWLRNDVWVVSWQDNQGWHDVQVRGGNPKSAIRTDISPTNIMVAGDRTETLYATNKEDWFVFSEDSTGDYYKGDSDLVIGFDDTDQIFVPGGLVFGGTSDSPAQGQYTIWEDGIYDIVTWTADGEWRDVKVQGNVTEESVTSSFDLWAA